MGATVKMTDLVPVNKGKKHQISLLVIQDRLDARREVEEARSGVSTRKSRVEDARRDFVVDPLRTVVGIQDSAKNLADTFDASITDSSIPLTQDQINRLSAEFVKVEELKVQLEALEGRYRSLIFGHLDETGPKIPGRPPAQVPGKVEAEGPGLHYVFERRGGNRESPDLDIEGLRKALPPHLAEMIYKTVHHPAVDEWDEDVFDEAEFGRLVDAGTIDLDVVAAYLNPGKWRTPSFYKTPVEGSK